LKKQLFFFFEFIVSATILFLPF